MGDPAPGPGSAPGSGPATPTCKAWEYLVSDVALMLPGAGAGACMLLSALHGEPLAAAWPLHVSSLLDSNQCNGDASLFCHPYGFPSQTMSAWFALSSMAGKDGQAHCLSMGMTGGKGPFLSLRPATLTTLYSAPPAHAATPTSKPVLITPTASAQTVIARTTWW